MVESKIFKTGWEALGFKSYMDYLNSYLWKNKRDFVINLRGNKCEKCDSRDNLNVHHLNYDNVCNERSRDLIVLCFKCHNEEHKKCQ